MGQSTWGNVINAGNAMRALTMSTMDSLETVYPFWAANRQCAPMTATAVMEEPVSADRAKNVPKTLTAAHMAVIELVITDNAVHRVQRTQIARAVHRVICANMLIACVREATADSYRFRIGYVQYDCRQVYSVVCIMYQPYHLTARFVNGRRVL